MHSVAQECPLSFVIAIRGLLYLREVKTILEVCQNKNKQYHSTLQDAVLSFAQRLWN